jgi:hypothetical protein
MKERARINKIKAIKRLDGTTCHNQKEIEEVAKEFYTNLFTAQNDVEPDLVTEWVQRSVTDNMNEFLSAPFTVEEIEKALFMMDPNKSPDHDGFTAGFFQKHWNFLKNDTCVAVLDLLQGGDLLPGMNNTVLVLIPKVKNLQEMSPAGIARIDRIREP